MNYTNLETAISKFEAAFASNPGTDFREFAPESSSDNFGEVVTELIRVDIELNFNTENQKSLEEYKLMFPDVVGNADCFDRIAFEEYRLRVSKGESVTPDDYKQLYDLRTYHWPLFGPADVVSSSSDSLTAEGTNTGFIQHGTLTETKPDLAGRLVAGGLTSNITIEGQLHRRLKFVAITIVLSLAYLAGLAWLSPTEKVGLFLGNHWLIGLHIFCIAVGCLICLALWIQRRISLGKLRTIELLLFGSVLFELSCGLVSDLFVDRELTRPIDEGQHELFHYSSSWSLPFFALIVAYGTLIPSSWLRCSSVVTSIGVVPVVICSVAAIYFQSFTQAFIHSFLLQMIVWMVIGAAIAIYGVRRLEQSHAELLKSGKLGKYQLIRSIATGGMGEVFEANHKLLGRKCAIKIMHRNWSLHPELLSRFEREVQVLAGISHSNVVQINDFGLTNDGIFYYVMELLEGKNLDQNVKDNGPFPAKWVVEVIIQIADALSEIHGGGIVHRDVKPSNIFVQHRLRDSRPKVKLLDFGLVKASDDFAAGLTHDGQVIGTPAYMSPEQAAGMEVDQRTDIYSLAAVAYFALTGTRLFDRGSAVETLSAHINAKPPEIVEQIPIELKEILLRCLAKDPKSRFQTAENLAEALGKIN